VPIKLFPKTYAATTTFASTKNQIFAKLKAHSIAKQRRSIQRVDFLLISAGNKGLE